MYKIDLEEATIKHSKIIWKLRNDPLTRSMSINKDFIEWENHKNWLDKSLKDADKYIYLGKYRSEFIGLIRFDKKDQDKQTFLININLDKSKRGMGFGKILLKNCIERLIKLEPKIKFLEAVVLKNNRVSNKFFLNNNFKKYSSKDTTINIYKLFL